MAAATANRTSVGAQQVVQHEHASKSASSVQITDTMVYVVTARVYVSRQPLLWLSSSVETVHIFIDNKYAQQREEFDNIHEADAIG